MAAPITTINPRGINTTGDYVVNSISSTGNVTAGNIRTDHLLHANGDPYVFTSNAAGTNTQVQFNDGDSFAGSANLTFNKTTGTLTADFFVGNGSQLTGLPSSYTDTNANSAIDARVTKSFIDNLNVDADTLDGLSSLDFATAAQGTKADTALQPSALTGYATELFVGNTVANLVNSAPALLDTLGELANAIGNDASFTTTITNQLANKANSADLSTVALTGNYADLNNKPTLFDGTYANLTGKPTLFDGEYASLANKPALFSGSYLDLTNTPTLFDGTYANLTGKPTLGTAAATDANAYATSAQGTKADTALQSVDLAGYATETYVTNAIANIPNPASVTVSATAPLTPIEGDLWLDSDTGEMSIYFGNAWVAPTTSVSTALTVTANAQPNITSVGTLTGLTVNGNITANYFIGNGSQLTGLPAGYTNTDANAAIDARVTKTFVDALGVNANTLNGHSDTYFATSTQGSLADSAVQPGDLATVATTGSYNDLLNKPALFDGTYANLTGKPTLFDGEYASLANKPTLFDGTYANLTGKPTLFSGAYSDLTGKPTLANVATSGSYTDLIDKPSLFDGEYASLANKPTLFSGSYVDLTNKPTLGTAAATDSTDYATAAQGAKADTALQPSDLTGYATESYVGNTITNLINAAPGSLDTLGELANALGNDANYSTTITTALAGKLSTTAFASTADTWLSTKSTSDVSEGTNLYYTATRANSAIDARVTKTFVDNLGVNANTLNGHADTYFATSTQGTKADTAVQPGDLATVATTGSYSDLTGKPTLFDGTYANLTGKPTLGTAAATNANAYATAAQGLLADSAIQTGANISVFTNDSGYLVAANLSGYATESYVGTQISNLVDAAPTTLNTLNELAAALGDDPSFATSIAASIGNKLSTSDFTTTADTWLGTKSTTDLAEGTNLYYTTTRANSAIDARVTKTFVDNLSVVANVANVAYSVAVANVTGIGNIATLNLNGNASTILYGNGIFAAAPVTYNDSNVATYLPNYTGNLTPGNIIISSNNLKLSGGTANYVLSTDGTGNLSWVEQTGGGASTESIQTTVDSFTGDGTATTFTLSITPQTINQTFVNYNGALQLRSSYSLDGANIVFSEAPANGAEFEVTTQTNVITGSGIVSANSFSVGNLSVTSYVTGNLVPNANVTYNLGSSDHRWKDLYLSGNTIDLAGAKIKSDPTTGSIAFVPPATVNAPNPTALVISPSGAISTSVTTNGVLAANAFSSAIVTGTVSSPRYISMVKTGNITAPSSSTRYYPPSNVQIRNVIATLDTPATDSFEFTVFKNGSNVGNFSMSANTYKLDSTSANITMTGSDYLIITVTAGTGAADLRVDLEYTVV